MLMERPDRPDENGSIFDDGGTHLRMTIFFISTKPPPARSLQPAAVDSTGNRYASLVLTLPTNHFASGHLVFIDQDCHLDL